VDKKEAKGNCMEALEEDTNQIQEALFGMGLSIEQAGMAWSRKKYWRLSKTPQLNTVMGVAYFRERGLINLVERYSLIRY